MSILIGLPMPQPGETITEGLVVRWIAAVGATVAEKEAVVELETAKAVYDYESPIGGTLVRILTAAGESQQVGQPLALFECEDAAAKKYLRLGVAVAVDAAGKAADSVAKIGATSGMGAQPSSTTVVPTATATTSSGPQLFLPPLLRTLAKEHGLADAELAAIPGTGPEGRLTKSDLLAYVAKRPDHCAVSAAAQPAQKGWVVGEHGVTLPPPLAGSTRTESPPVRRRIAENMVLSKTTIPHAGTAVSVDMTDLLALRDRAATGFAATHGAKLRAAPFFVFAVREGLKRFPVCNNFYFIDAAGKHWIEEHTAMNLGIAVGTERGLMVPVLKQAQDKDFLALAKESHALMEKAIAGKLTPDELSGATVTINNPGALGSVCGDQVIPWPQALIVGFHGIQELPRFVNGQCVPRQIMELGVSFDHRLIDGVEALGFLNVCKNVLEHPGKYFTEV